MIRTPNPHRTRPLHSAAFSIAPLLFLLASGCSGSVVDPSDEVRGDGGSSQDGGSGSSLDDASESDARTDSGRDSDSGSDPSADGGLGLDSGSDARADAGSAPADSGPSDAAPADSSGGFVAIPLDPHVRSELDDIVRPFVDPEGAAGKAIGLSIAVVGPGFRDVLGYGTTAKGGGVTPKADTIFEIGSITKVITGLLLAQQVAEGRVELDDPVAQYLPSGTVVPSLGGVEITLRHLATHTSGLPQMPSNLVGSPPNPAAGYTPELLYEFLARCRLASVPGTRYAYSNVGIGLLGHVLSLLHGKASFDELIEDVIGTRIGMKDTLIDAGGTLADRRARGYDAGAEVPPNVIDTLEAGGALRSTGADLIRFMEAGIAPPSTVAPLMALLLSPQSDVGPEPGSEMGLGIAIGREAEAKVFLKAGGTGGFSSFMIFSSEIEMGVSVLANDHRFDAAALAKEIFRRLAANGSSTGARRVLFAFGRAKPTDPQSQQDRMRNSVEAVASGFQSVRGDPFDSTVLIGEGEVSVDEVKRRLAGYVTSLREDDTFVMYSHTHGGPDGIALGSDVGGPGMLGWEDLASAILELPARNVIVLTMACHSGYLTATLDSRRSEWVGRSAQGRNLVVMASVAKDQLSDASRDPAIGNPFTYAVTTAIDGAADGYGARPLDGVIDLGELSTYVPAMAHEKSDRQEHDPQLTGDFSVSERFVEYR